MTKIFNFALKIKGVVGRVAEAKSSDPATPPKFGTCTLCLLYDVIRAPDVIRGPCRHQGPLPCQANVR